MNIQDLNIRRTGGFGSLLRLIAPAANVRDPLRLRLLAGIAVVVPKAKNINLEVLKEHLMQGGQGRRLLGIRDGSEQAAHQKSKQHRD